MGIHLFLSLQLASYILKLVTHNLSTERRQRVKIAIIGTGYVGSCFPKDTEALCSIATSYGYEFKTLQAVISANKRQRELMVEKIKYLLGDFKDKTIGLLGLAFKQNTDDLCQSLQLILSRYCKKKGHK